MEFRLNDGFSLGDSLQRSFDVFFEALPIILLALVVFVVGYAISRMVERATKRLMNSLNVNRHVENSEFSTQALRMFPNPAASVGRLAFWVVMLGVISLTVSVLGIPALTDFVAAVYGYLPNVLAAILIFVGASAVSGFANSVVNRTMGETATGKILTTTVPIVVMSIAFFMILDQLRIASDIVNITYTAIIGGIALGLALAFGLGGRDVANKILQNAYDKGHENYAQMKKDINTGKSNARRETKKVKRSLKD